MYDLGVIHGRFQILHNDHLKYLLAGKSLCRHLVVGITNPDPVLTTDVQVDRNRSAALSNPLTYYERLIMIQAALQESAISSHDLTVVPFPITRPELYKYYVPLDAVFFLSIYDDWGRKKLDQFKSLDLATHVLWEVAPEQKGISSTDIRKLILDSRPWEHLVPASVARLCRKWDLPARLAKLAGSHPV
ncbi:nicotinate-nucleotide adenylyltransferase [Desulfonatronovibrio hydrogenovorans]|uniref:nicotinate-nucleotide adenylyltransferase n=1 Tax=Desulfonatronovibrio hydrogenovorans TaxID=53245 RepID=UPI000689C2F7|nr:nicotinate-nucleotide adenylyltransferase [Desulfonatronovibrio hydrogenovorans]